MIIINNNNHKDKKYNNYNKKTPTRKKKNSDTYLLHPNYEENTLSNMQRKHYVHCDQKGHISSIYDTTIAVQSRPFMVSII